MMTSSIPCDTLLEIGDQIGVFRRRGVPDRVRNVERRRSGLDRRREDLDQEIPVGARRVLAGELDIAREGLREGDGIRDSLQHLLAGHPELVLEMDVGGREERVNAWRFSAARTACAARSISLAFARASPATTDPLTRSAISLTASKSPGDAAGKPASMMSTPSSTSASAISSFSSTVIVAPGDCSPSRRVVSKIQNSRTIYTTLRVLTLSS